jgi:hypothetical protein
VAVEALAMLAVLVVMAAVVQEVDLQVEMEPQIQAVAVEV